MPAKRKPKPGEIWETDTTKYLIVSLSKIRYETRADFIAVSLDDGATDEVFVEHGSTLLGFRCEELNPSRSKQKVAFIAEKEFSTFDYDNILVTKKGIMIGCQQISRADSQKLVDALRKAIRAVF